MTTETSNPNSLDAQLAETEMGDFFAKHKNLIITVIAVLILGVIGWGIYKNQRDNRHDELSQKIALFETGKLKEFKDKKLDEKTLVSSFNALGSEVGSFKGGFAISLQTADALVAQGKLVEALEVLKWSKDNYSSGNQYMAYLLAVRMQVIYEDQNKVDEAITVLKDLHKSSVSLMESKTYYDLGRLYLIKGDKAMAKKNFEQVLEDTKDKELTKLAKLYLSKVEGTP